MMMSKINNFLFVKYEKLIKVTHARDSNHHEYDVDVDFVFFNRFWTSLPKRDYWQFLIKNNLVKKIMQIIFLKKICIFFLYRNSRRWIIIMAFLRSGWKGQAGRLGKYEWKWIKTQENKTRKFLKKIELEVKSVSQFRKSVMIYE